MLIPCNMFPRSTNATFAEKLYQTFKDHKRFKKPKLSTTYFTICHYAGDVTYQSDYFLDKSKDYVVAEHQALMNASKCFFVSSLFPPSSQDSSKASKFISIGTQFKQQLQALLEEPHYVCCVKPNNLLKPAIFENQNILQQLRCGGVMETIRISCAGFPTRKPFHEFVEHFKILSPNVIKLSNEVEASKILLKKANLQGYQKDNVANQREHLILLLANVHIRQIPKPDQQPKTNTETETSPSPLEVYYKLHYKEKCLWPKEDNTVSMGGGCWLVMRKKDYWMKESAESSQQAYSTPKQNSTEINELRAKVSELESYKRNYEKLAKFLSQKFQDFESTIDSPNTTEGDGNGDGNDDPFTDSDI